MIGEVLWGCWGLVHYTVVGDRGGVVGLLLDVGASPLYSSLGDRGGVVGPLLDVGASPLY